MHLYKKKKKISSAYYFFGNFLKSGTDKLLEWSAIPACPSIMCFFNWDSTEGANSSKILCLTFVYVCFVLYKFVSGLIL